MDGNACQTKRLRAYTPNIVIRMSSMNLRMDGDRLQSNHELSDLSPWLMSKNAHSQVKSIQEMERRRNPT